MTKDSASRMPFPIAALASSSTRTASDFESSFAGVNTVTNELGRDIAIRALAKAKKWREDDRQGYDAATDVLCELEDALAALLAELERAEPTPEERVLAEVLGVQPPPIGIPVECPRCGLPPHIRFLAKGNK